MSYFFQVLAGHCYLESNYMIYLRTVKKISDPNWLKSILFVVGYIQLCSEFTFTYTHS